MKLAKQLIVKPGDKVKLSKHDPGFTSGLKKKRDAEKLASELASLSCTIRMQAGENDRLFGSVTALDIAAALEEQGIEIDRRKIILDEPLKELGIFTVPAKVHPDVTADIKVWVVKA